MPSPKFEEVDPVQVGMNRAVVEEARRVLYDLHDSGRYPALQICVRRRGKIVLHEAIGDYRPIDGGRRREVDFETRFALFSISKCVAATCMHLLFDREVLHVDDPVCWYIAEFGQRGKEHVTLRHILSHQAGIPMIFWNLTDELIRDRERILQTICEQKPWHVPGRRTGYHILSAGYIIAEVIRRVDGRPIEIFLREEILDPLGFETFDYGIDESRWDQTAASERVDRLPPRFVLDFFSRILDVDIEQALAVMNRPAVFETVIPSGNIVGTAEETSRFFEMLLAGGELDGTRILSPEQVTRATVEQVMTTADWTLLLTPQRYSLGFMLGRKSTELNVFGKGTEQTFGHLGFARNLGWADREKTIAGGFLTSGKPVRPGREVLLLRRFQNLLREACVD